MGWAEHTAGIPRVTMAASLGVEDRPANRSGRWAGKGWEFRERERERERERGERAQRKDREFQEGEEGESRREVPQLWVVLCLVHGCC